MSELEQVLAALQASEADYSVKYWRDRETRKTVRAFVAFSPLTTAVFLHDDGQDGWSLGHAYGHRLGLNYTHAELLRKIREVK